MNETSGTEPEQTTHGPRKRRLPWLILGGVLVLLAGGGTWTYAQLRPQSHFQTVPVLRDDAQPAQSAQGNDSTQQATAPHTPPVAQPTAAGTTQSNGAFNILILGIDSGNAADSRTDVIMVAHVNLQDKTINLVSIPRDTRVDLPGVGYTKINHAHFLGNIQDGNHGGTEEALQAVSHFLNVQFNYYVKTDFAGFAHLVDTIGGVDVQFSQAVGTLSAGPHHLNGAEALEAVRERYSLPRGDLDREADQEVMLDALLQKVLQPSNIPKLPSLYKQVRSDLVDTNFTDSDLLSLALLFKGMHSDQVHYVQIPGKNGVAYDPLVKMNLDYWIPDRQAVQQISETYLHDK